MDAAHQKAALSHSVADGIFGTAWTSLTGGAFLVGFALKIFHADSRVIGALAALPLLANVVQVAGSLLIERTGRKKPVSIAGVMAGRLAWVAVILLPFLAAPGTALASWPLIAAMGVSSLFAAVGSVGWTAWMGDLVPARQRGAFFGRRNMIASVAGTAALLLGGRALDAAARAGIPDRSAFAGLFSAGLLCGMVSVWFLFRLPETGAPPAPRGKPADLSLIFRPLRDANFRTLILSVCAWSVAVQVAGP
ncbi:MAG TPA: MFS transporter, partial [Spirochaetia bacterium]|nr:MFS transporter [Spirochaetia bacterium]